MIRFSGILLIVFFAFRLNAQPEKMFTKEVYKNNEKDSLLYRAIYPFINFEDCTNKNVKYPLVIFLHGAGERGNDNEKQLKHGVKIFTKPKNLIKYPCFVIAPQCPVGKRWVEVSWSLPKHNMPEKPSESVSLLMQLIDDFCKKYPVDTTRIYVTGLSMGGFGTWDVISRYPDKFAAAVPICGGGDENQASKIANIPIWAFHGGKDRVVKTYRTRNMIKAIKKEGGKPKYTEFPKLGHFSWKAAYNTKGLLKWMFSQKISKK